jgi:parallel beta-helix repeat protein
MNQKLVLALTLTLLVGMLNVAFNAQRVKASGTIYIRADGSVDPLDAPISTVDHVTYTLTANISSDADGIVVERDNIVIDGAGFTLQGTGSGTGILLDERSSVTIRNMGITLFHDGIFLDSSSEVSIIENNIANNSDGIYFYSSFSNSVSGNNITANDDYGILLLTSSNNGISGNSVTAADGYGIKLISSNSSSIEGNDIAANDESGIWLTSSSNENSIGGNSITANNWHGIRLDSSSGNSISGNTITHNEYFDGYGIHLYFCTDNTISGNDIANNHFGILLTSSSGNRFYHNNFIDNTQQVYFHSSSYPNVWDDGYPSGGNYWSDYLSRYSNASQIYASGIWNQSYSINASNMDNYPLMNQYVIPEFPSFLILPLFMLATLFAAFVWSKKRPYQHSP